MRKLGFLFSGQGAQKPGMMKELYDTTCARDVFDRVDEALGRPISELCFSGTQEELNLTHNTQPCVLAADIAAFEAFRKYGMVPDAVAGFSLGEYAAIYAAGVISLEDVIRLIQRRADAMQTAVPVGEGGMLAVIGAAPEVVEQICEDAEGLVEAVNYNCPGQIVLSGTKEGIQSAAAICKEKKIRAIPLPVSAPFHSSLMKPAAEEVAAALEETKLNDASIPVYTNVDALPTTDSEELKGKLIRQTMSPVRWEKTIRNMIEDGIDFFVEFGPGKTLAGFVKRISDSVEVYSVENTEAMETVVSAWKGVEKMATEDKIKLLEELLEADEGSLQLDTALEDIDSFDSMAKLSLIVLFDDEFGKKLTGDQIKGFSTIGDIVAAME